MTKKRIAIGAGIAAAVAAAGTAVAAIFKKRH